MKHVYAAIGTIILLAPGLTAQQDGARFGGRSGASLTRPPFPLGGRTNFGGRRFSGRGLRGFDGGFPWVYPAFYGDYGLLDDYPYGYPYDNPQPQQPNIYIVMPGLQEPPEPPAPPPPPPAPVIREYHWQEQAQPPAPFSIVTTNGTVYYATLAWVQGDRIYFHSTEGGSRQLPLSSVSKSLTQAANAQKGLRLPLP
jgi:hypothetical protein